MAHDKHRLLRWNDPCSALAIVVVRRYRDLIAWQMGDAFKKEVFRLVRGSPQASANLKFRSQILEAARSVPINIAEGFLRFSSGDFARFLAISLGSLGEAESHLRDGIQQGYFLEDDLSAGLQVRSPLRGRDSEVEAIPKEKMIRMQVPRTRRT